METMKSPKFVLTMAVVCVVAGLGFIGKLAASECVTVLAGLLAGFGISYVGKKS